MRTIVCIEDDTPPRLDVAEFVANLKSGCATVSGGPFVTIRSGDVRMGGIKTAKSGRLEVQVKVQSPSWIPTDRLIVYVDGRVERKISLSSESVVRFDEAIPIRCQSDCFVTVLVEGDAMIDDVLTTYRSRQPRPIALTNPIFVDVDGDGRYR